jgi:RpiB/LacA/LacB family sugar-phosphate isomerase
MTIEVFMKPILIASDHAGFALKEELRAYLEKIHVPAKDLGTHSAERCDYPDYAAALARKISCGSYKRGILICYTGIGISIVANRFPKVRAALCYNKKAAELSRRHNDSNVLVLGAGFVDVKQAKETLKAWLEAEFEGGRHKQRLDILRKLESGACCCPGSRGTASRGRGR